MLRYFVAIADAGSIGAAADALYLAQPSLSEQLRKLERTIGYDLFVRSPRGVIPTERANASGSTPLLPRSPWATRPSPKDTSTTATAPDLVE